MKQTPMGLRLYKPTTNARRNASVNLPTEVTKNRPEKSLLRPLTKTGGRNNQGKITVRGRGQDTSGDTASSTSDGPRTTCPQR